MIFCLMYININEWDCSLNFHYVTFASIQNPPFSLAFFGNMNDGTLKCLFTRGWSCLKLPTRCGWTSKNPGGITTPLDVCTTDHLAEKQIGLQSALVFLRNWEFGRWQSNFDSIMTDISEGFLGLNWFQISPYFQGRGCWTSVGHHIFWLTQM